MIRNYDKTTPLIECPPCFFRHDDPDATRNNAENECYCLQDNGFKCLPSGAMYIEPCKRADQAPVARFHVSGT